MFSRFRSSRRRLGEFDSSTLRDAPSEGNLVLDRERQLTRTEEGALPGQEVAPQPELAASSSGGEVLSDTAHNDYVTAAAAAESRAKAWETETRRLFLQRTQTLCLLTIGCTPLFWFAYTRVAPQALPQISLAHLLLMMASLVIFWLARYSPSHMIARALTVLLYCVFGWAAAVAVASAGDERVSAFSGHQQILISILFMPFSLIEAAICAALVTLSFTFGLGNALTPGQWREFVPHILSFALSGAMISIMAHLQCLVRRRAFDANFSMAIDVARSAQLSTLDSITGGWNRRYLEMALGTELKRVVRFHQPAALLMFDLDNFKRVNDELGHPVGDTVLREVHSATLHTLRHVDTVARYGGDEFAVILPGVRVQDALYTATRISEAVSQHLVERFGAESLAGQVTLSIGVAAIPSGEPLTFIEAIQRADEKLYEAKRAGKNRIRVG